MTIFSIWISASIAAGRAVRAAGQRLARWSARVARRFRPRRRAPRLVIVADDYLHEYTGLTRSELDQAFRDPVWSRRSAGIDRPLTARERRLSERAAYYPL